MKLFEWFKCLHDSSQSVVLQNHHKSNPVQNLCAFNTNSTANPLTTVSTNDIKTLINITKHYGGTLCDSTVKTLEAELQNRIKAKVGIHLKTPIPNKIHLISDQYQKLIKDLPSMKVTLAELYLHHEYNKVLASYVLIYDRRKKEYYFPNHQYPFEVGTCDYVIGPPVAPFRLLISRLKYKIIPFNKRLNEVPYKTVKLSFEKINNS